MARSLNWLVKLLEGQIDELTRQEKATRLWTWLLTVVGLVSCVALYIYCALQDLERLLSFGPGLVNASAVLPFRSMMTLRQKLTLMSGLREQCRDDEDLSQRQRDHLVDLVKEALTGALKG